jgi:methyltransferase (TIGR00027 family)
MPQADSESQDREWDVMTGVGVTALGVASARAIETNRADALADDPYAAAFVRAAPMPNQMPTTPEELEQLSPADSWVRTWRYMGVRTRYFDDFCARSGDAGLRQVVILASGLDARPFRLTWAAGTTVYEIDRAPMLDFKRGVLEQLGATANCDHHLVAADLRESWTTALCAAGFQPGTPTAWLIEGLLPYLPPSAATQLLTDLSRLSAPGSRAAIEDPKRISQALPDDEYQWAADQWGVDLRTLLHEDQHHDATAVLRALGWQAGTEPIAAAANRYGQVLDPRLTALTEASQFVTAERPAEPEPGGPGLPVPAGLAW